VSVFVSNEEESTVCCDALLFVQSQSYGGIQQGIGVELAQTQDDTSCILMQDGQRWSGVVMVVVAIRWVEGGCIFHRLALVLH
jgi:hypothetical protein